METATAQTFLGNFPWQKTNHALGQLFPGETIILCETSEKIQEDAIIPTAEFSLDLDIADNASILLPAKHGQPLLLHYA